MRQQPDIESTIVAISNKITGLTNAYDYVKDLVDSDTSSGFNIYRGTLLLIIEYTSVLQQFLQSLKYYSASVDVTAQQIISSAESLINQMIAKDTIRQGIKTQIALGGGSWPTELAIPDSVFDTVANDLKTILGALLVICNTQSSVESQMDADNTLLAKLQNLNIALDTFPVVFNYVQTMIDFINGKLSRYNIAKEDFRNIFIDILENYQRIVTSDYNRILYKNIFFSKGFSSLIREKVGYDRSQIVIDETDNNLVISGTKYDFSTQYLSPLSANPSNFQNQLADAQNQLTANIDLMEGTIKKAGESMIIKMFDLAKGDSIVRISNCITNSAMDSEFNGYISADMDGVRALVTLSYFAVSPFSDSFSTSFDAATQSLANAISSANSMTNAVLQFRAVRSQ